MGSSRSGDCGLVGVGGYPGSEAAGRVGQRLPDWGGNRVERANGPIDGIRPGSQVRRACALALGLGRVLTVVAGQIQVRDVEIRVAAVQLKFAVTDPGRSLEDLKMCLVVIVGERIAVPEPAQACPNAVGRQVLDHAVVFVPAAIFAYLGDGHVPDGANIAAGTNTTAAIFAP